jgi:FkbM family methyltransferase
MFYALSRRELRPFLRQGIAPSIEHNYVLNRYGTECSYFLDIGANVGQFLLAAHLIHDQKFIFSFEPYPGSLKKLLKVSSLHRNSQVFQFGLSDCDGSIPLNVSFNKNNDSSSFLAPSSLQLETFNQKFTSSSSALKVFRLDSIVSSLLDLPDRNGFMKIDVQGYEFKVLLGASQTIKSFIKYIYVELSFVEFYQDQALAGSVVSLLNDLGFCLIGVYNIQDNTNDELLQADFLFRRN